MKKIFFFAAIAALASCTSEELAQTPEINAEDGAVAFGANILRDARVYNNDDINLAGLQDAASPGFGVFAYEHGTTAWNTYNTYNTVPNFMFNEDVTWDSGNSVWTYSPVKYFSNNDGAMHSFFAYAPYDKDVKAVFSLANGAPAIRYNAADNYDLLYASKTEVKKLDVASKVNFTFAHALSKVDFKVTYFVDEVHNGTHPSDGSKDDFKDTYTTITVRSVKFVGAVPSQGVLNLDNGNWTYEATEEGAYEFSTPQTFTWNGSSADAAMAYKNLKLGNLVIPTIDANNVKIQVVYDVTTVDQENPRNNSTITNTITSQESYALVKGKHYTFKLDLGLTSVKFNVTDVAAWEDVSDKTVDLPDNMYPGLALVSFTTAATTAARPATCAVGDICYVTETDKYYKSVATNDWTGATELTPATIFYNTADGKYYTNAAFTEGAKLPSELATGYYIIGTTLYVK